MVVVALASLIGCERSAADKACGPKGATYIACGCGCCGEPSTDHVKCIDTGRGETLASVEAADKAAKASKQCAVIGCSHGTVYKCCD